MLYVGSRPLFNSPFLGAVCGGTSVCGSLTSWHVRGLGWFCLWALDIVEVCSGRVCGETFFSRGCSMVSMRPLSRLVCVPRVASALRTGYPFWALFVRLTPLLSSGAHATSVVFWFARATVGFVVGLRICGGVSRRLREPTCGVAFTSAGVWSVELVEGVLCLSASLLELSRCSVCRVALLVEHCDICLWLLSTLCWLVVNSGEVLPEFFAAGSGGSASLGCPVFSVRQHRFSSISLAYADIILVCGGKSFLLAYVVSAAILEFCPLI
ncbi:hypothetical protein Taro_057033 [Colocasia esculenta]|uniref:Uncharacterized protein n=1 Tax=Colocasia esculenta TaxID=4460 RepID=A0A843XXW7_COLES|nr:hypothetical protein [Colocasia esculenta]